MTTSKMGKYFLNRTQKALISKERIGKLITLKLETVHLNTIERVKSHSTEQEKIFATHIANRKLIYISQISIRKAHHPI